MSRQAELRHALDCGNADRQHIEVVAGLIVDEQSQVLVALRPDDGRHGAGQWEFPGGKLAIGESQDDALARELLEEIGIVVERSEPFHSLRHAYPERIVTLHFHRVLEWRGTPSGREGQSLRWVAPAELSDYSMLPADAPVIELLQQMLS